MREALVRVFSVRRCNLDIGGKGYSCIGTSYPHLDGCLYLLFVIGVEEGGL